MSINSEMLLRQHLGTCNSVRVNLENMMRRGIKNEKSRKLLTEVIDTLELVTAAIHAAAHGLAPMSVPRKGIDALLRGQELLRANGEYI